MYKVSKVQCQVRSPWQVSSSTMWDLIPGICRSQKDFNDKGYLALRHYDHGFAFQAKGNGKYWKEQDYKSSDRSRESINLVYNTDMDVTGVVGDYRNWK